jgi:hypothetical protein
VLKYGRTRSTHKQINEEKDIAAESSRLQQIVLAVKVRKLIIKALIFHFIFCYASIHCHSSVVSQHAGIE